MLCLYAPTQASARAPGSSGLYMCFSGHREHKSAHGGPLGPYGIASRILLGTRTVRTRDSSNRKCRYAFVVTTDGLDSSPMCGVTWSTKIR